MSIPAQITTNGAFLFLLGEAPAEFEKLQDSLRTEHQPETSTEMMLVETMARHYWLMQRATRLQSVCFNDVGICDAEKQLGLYLRYQTTHERSFYKALNTLLKLRADKKKSEIGFVSQEAALSRERGVRSTSASAPERADKARQQSELNQARVRLANAKAQHLETEPAPYQRGEDPNAEIRQTIEAPLPGHLPIPFNDLSAMFRMAVDHVNRQISEQEAKQAA